MVDISILGFIIISVVLLLFVTERKIVPLVNKLLIIFVIMTQIPIGYVLLLKNIDIPVTVPRFFALIFLFLLVMVLCRGDIKIKLSHKTIFYISLFFFSCLLSILITAIHPPNLLVLPITQEGTNVLIPLRFSYKQVAELIRLVLYVIIFIVFYNFPRREEGRIKIVKLLLVVTVLHGFYGLLEKFILFPLDGGLHREILADIVGRSYSYSVITPLRAGSFTISGFASEPGAFAGVIGIGMGILAYNLVFGNKIFNRKAYDIVSLLVVVSAVILSGSTTGIIIVIVTFLLLLVLLIKKRYIKTLSVIIFIITAGMWVFKKYILLAWHRLTTLANPSDRVRLRTMMDALDVFKKSPLLGAGFGASKSYSVITVLLSNVGIIGTISYLLFYFSIVIKPFKESSSVFLKAIGFTLVVSFIVGISSGGFPSLFNPEVWMLLGILAGERNSLSRGIHEQ